MHSLVVVDPTFLHRDRSIFLLGKVSIIFAGFLQALINYDRKKFYKISTCKFFDEPMAKSDFETSFIPFLQATLPVIKAAHNYTDICGKL